MSGKSNGRVSKASTPAAGVHRAGAAAGHVPTPAAAQQTTPIPTTQPTDSYIPSYLKEVIPELDSYERLVEAEKKLDVYLARKKIDLQQSLMLLNKNKNSLKTTTNSKQAHYLRVFVSNIAENQPWQDPSQDISNASWTMRIEGRLLDDQDVADPSRPKFSSFFQAIAVDFKKPKKEHEGNDSAESVSEEVTGNETLENNDSKINIPLQVPQSTSALGSTTSSNEGSNIAEPDSDIIDAVEWHHDPKNPVAFDGLDIKRPGSENVECTVTIQPKETTAKRLRYSEELASIIGTSEGTLNDAIYSLYKYILINKLLKPGDSSSKANGKLPSDIASNEKTMIQLDEALQQLVKPKNTTTAQESNTLTSLNLTSLLSLVNLHISPIPPIKLDYTVRVDKASTYGELVFDVDVTDILERQQHPSQAQQQSDLVADTASLFTEYNNLNNHLKPQLQELETHSQTLKLQLNASASKYQFFHKIAQDPVPVLEEYITSSANALKVLSGDEGFNEDTVRRSQFYQDNEAMLFENLGVLLANGRM